MNALPARDAALEALFLPFIQGTLAWPHDSDVRFLRARAGWRLPAGGLRIDAARVHCEQTFKPFADALEHDGCTLADEARGQRYPLVLMLPPRQRDEARALMARALALVEPGGTVVASMRSDEGGRSGEADFRRLLGEVESLSKYHCRVFYAAAQAERIDTALCHAWRELDAPRTVVEGRFTSRPGLFAWDRIDAASALLASQLPRDLSGRGADLGAGFGYLATEVLARNPGVTALDLYEAEGRALELAMVNVAAHAGTVALDFLWHDVTRGLRARYDFIVTNPPFHASRDDAPGIGRAFIAAAAAALVPGGRLWLVANRHLPYESVLNQRFGSVRSVLQKDGFKIIEAIRATNLATA